MNPIMLKPTTVAETLIPATAPTDNVGPEDCFPAASVDVAAVLVDVTEVDGGGVDVVAAGVLSRSLDCHTIWISGALIEKELVLPSGTDR